MYTAKRIAIITPDRLQIIGLQSVLAEYFPPVQSTGFGSFSDFRGENPDSFDHYFVATETFVLHADYFLPRRSKTTVLVTGAENQSGAGCLNIYSPREIIIEQIQPLVADQGGRQQGEGNKTLSARETSVLQLIVTGHTNKDIADCLNISLNTVLTHRKNITAKLGIKTVSGLTFYAIMNGLISADDIEP